MSSHRRPTPSIPSLACLVVGAAVTAGAGASCSCGAPQAELPGTGLRVTLEEDGARLLLRRGDTVVLDVAAADVGSKDGESFYEMQFGMFNIEEDARPFVFGARFRAVTVGEGSIDLELTDGADVVLASGAVTADAGGALLTLKATGEADRMVLGAACDGDRFLGFGAHTHDVDHRGQVVPLWVSEQGVGKVDTNDLPDAWPIVGRRHTTHAPIPATVSSRGYALVADTPAFSRFDLCATDASRLTVEVWEPTLRLRVFAPGGGDGVDTGNALVDAQRAMADALGRPRLPAPWMHGVWNDAIFGEQNVRDVAATLRAAGVPVSALWTEDWRGGSDSGDLYRLDEDWRLDRALYPTYEDMAADLRADGIAPMVYYNTFVTEGGDVFDEITSAGYAIHDSTGETLLFTGVDRDFSPTALVDLTNPEAREYVKGHLKDALAAGAMGWMADFAEWMPVEDNLGEPVTLSSGEDPALVHNLYPVLWQEVNVEALAEHDAAALLADDGPVLFYRSAFLGSQPLVDVFWAGDQRTSFDVDDGLPTVIPLGIGTAVTGFPYYAHDIGGYQSSTNAPTTRELFFRWTSLGALSPVMRTHHGTHARQNHNVLTDEGSTAFFKAMADVHVRLYPYLRALAVQASATPEPRLADGSRGLPLWLPLPLLFPDDDAVWPLLDQVMLGPSLLVAPVVAEGATTRDVVFPSSRFAPFLEELSPSLFAAGAQVGPTTATVPAPLEEIPVYIAAGGIVPLLATPVDSLLPDVEGRTDLSDTEGDRVVVVGLGKAGTFVEVSGASYRLEGTGTTAPAGDTVVTGDGVVEGDGFTFTLSGQPAGRTTTVVFR